ncbi:MAG: hypothetical protein Q9M94_05065 [Candidatus Gracilibacteria bacterium]|nr:hypothetical protein [Candidatus Gracilibacteria bacterium]
MKTKSLSYRISLVNENLTKLEEKYKNKNYLILKKAEFYKKNNILLNKNFDLNNLKTIIPYYEVEEKTSGEIIFYKDGNKKNITSLQYYTIDSENVNLIIQQLNYNLDGYYLFKWNKAGKISYRLGFDVVIK